METHCVSLWVSNSPSPSLPPLGPCNQVSYQGIDIFHFHGPTVENVSAQDNKEEEKAQQHVAHVAEDVVEGTAGGRKV